MISYTLDLKDQLAASEQAAHALYEKNIESLAHILHIQQEKALNEEIYQKKVVSLESQVSHLLTIVEDQQTQLQTQSHWDKLTHVWKTLLPVNYPTTLKQIPADFEHLAYILTILSAKYLEDIDSLPTSVPPLSTINTPAKTLLDSTNPRQVVKENTSFIPHLLDEVHVLQSRMHLFDGLEFQNEELRRVLQFKAASLVKLQAEHDRMRIEHEQQIMRNEDLRQHLR